MTELYNVAPFFSILILYQLMKSKQRLISLKYLFYGEREMPYIKTYVVKSVFKK